MLPTFKRTEIGISHVLERRRVFPHLTVLQNLNLGAFHPRAKEQRSQSLEKIYKIFPKLEQRKDQLANTMSGGEQQMLAIARGLMGLPSLYKTHSPAKDENNSDDTDKDTDKETDADTKADAYTAADADTDTNTRLQVQRQIQL